MKMMKTGMTERIERCETCMHWDRHADDREDYGECKFDKDGDLSTRRFMSEKTDWCENHFGIMRL